MDNIKELQAGVVRLKKHLSLRQIALQSGMNYITLRNIESGKTVRVTDKVAAQLKKFVAGFDPKTAVPVLKKRGRKPGVKNAAALVKKAKPAAAPAEKKAAPKAAVKKTPKAAAKPGRKPGLKKAAPAVAPAPVKIPAKRGRKPGSKNIVRTAVPATPKVAAKRGRKPGRKPQAAAMAPAAEYSQMFLGAKLREEIAMVEARLSYLKTLEKAEAAYLSAIRKK